MREAEQVLVQDFLAALQAATGSELIDQKDEVAFDDRQRLDALLRVRMPNHPDIVPIAVEAEDATYPRDARRLVEFLKAFNAQGTHDRPPAAPVVVANYLTGTARDVLRECGVNYFEASSGTLFFRFGTWLIDIERPSKRALDRKIGSVFTGAREQVVHALLMHWHRAGARAWLAGNELANLAETSAFTVSKTLQELEKHEWVEATGTGPSQRRRLKNPAGLLDAWGDEWMRRARSEPRTRWYTYAGGRGGIVDRMLEKLENRQGWAISGTAAANARVPHLTAVDRVLVIVPPGLSLPWAEGMALEPADKGSNITFVERTGTSLQFLDEQAERPKSRFASPFIQYLDLLDGVGRNKELAREYRSQIFKLEERDHD
ncbi:hypothetical protein J7U46_22495 [Pelomonas sp. V22]|uniref:hypothetical protein n=1 Tax=Pelomonas sp. V22 TaxID=2822139 RepID=UPI0024A94C2C|nr:hypothetical protein [Pelomonas sp. V22]MDI4635853.1 hypothetical protein [Pelomonas sp. V22]